MNEYTKIKGEIEKDIEWFKKNIGLEDVYCFAQQSFIAAEYFLAQLADWVDVEEECTMDKTFNFWCKNVLGLSVFRRENPDYCGGINVKIKEEHEVEE